MKYVPSEDLAADALTNSLTQTKLEKHRKELMGEIQTIRPDAGKVSVGELAFTSNENLEFSPTLNYDYK